MIDELISSLPSVNSIDAMHQFGLSFGRNAKKGDYRRLDAALTGEHERLIEGGGQHSQEVY